MHRVRDIATPFNLGGGFRDELVATAMTLSLIVVGSFVLTEVFLGEEELKESAVVVENQPQTLGVSDQPEKIDLLPAPTPMLPAVSVVETASISASPSATTSTASEGAVVVPVVPFGED